MDAESTDVLFTKNISAFHNEDQIALDSEICYGEFHYQDFIVLNELFTPVQKWDLLFCQRLFNGEEELFSIQIINKSRQEHYQFLSNDFKYRDRLLQISKDLELVKMHLDFQRLGGSHEIPSRFTDLVQRAGWDNGIKMIKSLLTVLVRLQENSIIVTKDLRTRLSDRIQSDDHDIIYKFQPGQNNYIIYVRHLFTEDTTSVRIFNDGNDSWFEQIFKWDTED